MGEHGTWFDYLNRFAWWGDVSHQSQAALGRKWEWLMFGKSGWSLTHVLLAILTLLVVTWGAITFYRAVRSPDKGIIPPPRMNLRNVFEYLAESVYGMVEGALGEKNAPRFFPLIGALWMFILFGNLIGMIPGFIAPTDTLKTNVGIAIMVFLLTHYYGIRAHGLAKSHGVVNVGRFVGFFALAIVLGVGGFALRSYAGAPAWTPVVGALAGFYALSVAVPYFKHFLGPVWWLSPLMLIIELVSHVARPISLAMRLMGNMLADHKVVLAFFTLIPILVPVPFILLGVLVCVIQAFVFCTLTMVYIGMAIETEEH